MESADYSAKFPDLLDEECEMLAGYLDGLDPESPAPSENRSHSYRHGFANGRDDLNKSPRAAASDLRDMAKQAIEKDRSS